MVRATARTWIGLGTNLLLLNSLCLACSGDLTAQIADGEVAGPPEIGTDLETSGVPDPGRVTLHRLNRAEYTNTVRDLLGTDARPADAFPIDDRGSGFDNIADVLSLSPRHITLYHTAAQALVDEALSDPAQRAALVPCDLSFGGSTCVEATLRSFVPRAWRRPVTDLEIQTLMNFVNVAESQGDGPEQGLRLALEDVLLSPNFIFRVELDPDPTSLTPHPLTPHEVASRLSYFLWSTMPDAELFALADAATLQNPDVLSAQVTRMLAEDKARALVDNFAGQWLFLRKIDEVAPDPTVFSEFDSELRAAMKSETESLFESLVFGGGSMADLLTADYTFVNDRLAQHYGLAPVGSEQAVRVTLAPEDHRSGFLSHAGILTVTSHPTRTSPVNRGKWVMNELLCQAIPPPPPNVDVAGVDEEPAEGAPAASLRERLEIHRADPTCAACHQLMDPIGFGFENYDAIGAYRDTDNGVPIDATGTLPDGRAFSGPSELAALLSTDPSFPRCVASKVYTYALGRSPSAEPTHLDASVLESLTQAFVDSGYSFPVLLDRLVSSATFLNRRGELNPAGAL